MIFETLRSEPGDPGPDLDKLLASLEQQAESALPGLDAQYFNRAGDLCLQAEDLDRALRYYGRAVDAYLRAGRYNAAGAVCRKLLRARPGSVRARCTLAWLSIGRGLGEAHREVEEYAQAAIDAGQADLARKQIQMMAKATSDPELRALLAGQLHRIGDSETAERIMSAHTRDPEDREEAEALWSRVLQAALMGPEDLRDEE